MKSTYKSIKNSQKLRRKNSKEDYLDKQTIWEDLIIGNRLFSNILRRGIETLMHHSSCPNILKLHQNIDNSFTVTEYKYIDPYVDPTYIDLPEKSKLSSVILACHSDFDRISIYSKLKNQKSWKFEFNIRENELLGIHNRLLVLLVDFFPNFNVTFYLPTFRRLQREGEFEYETYLQEKARKKNPRKIKRIIVAKPVKSK